MAQPGTRRRFHSLGPIRPKSRSNWILPHAVPQVPYRDLFEFAALPFLVHDLEGRIVEANGRACESLGYAREELLALFISDVDVSDDRADLAGRWAALKLGQSLRRQGAYRRKDGTPLEVEIHSSLFQQADRPLFATVLRDADERRRLEEELRQAQKMEALGRMAGGVAHDFNNLLTAILGYSDILLARAGTDPSSRADLSEVKRAGERAAELTRQLLAFSRRQPTRPKVLDLNSIVGGIEGMLRRLFPETIRMEIDLASEELCVRMDPGQIDQVTLNLALNARDAMAGGGALRLTTSSVLLGPEFVQNHPGSAPGAYAVISVADTGVGIPKEQFDRLFEPFFTTKAVGKGTGLGLATVYGITKQAGGFLTVASEPGRGSTFRVYLPRIDDQPQSASDTSLVAIGFGSETILLVEDDRAVRGLVCQGLRSQGYTVLEAACPEEALRMLEGARRAPDLLLTDIVMPGMTGLELAKRLRARHPALKVVYMSGYNEEAVLQEGRIEKGAGFIPKPFVVADLVFRIRKTLNQ